VICWREREDRAAFEVAIDESNAGIVGTTYQVVGVARNSRTSGLQGDIRARFYMAFTPPHGDNVKRANFLIRTVMHSSVSTLRCRLPTADYLLPITCARTVQEQIAP
jgi:hypothetical protein